MDQSELEEFVESMTSNLNKNVFTHVHLALQKNPELRNQMIPSFPFPYKIRFGILNNVLAIEHIGPSNDKYIVQAEGIYNEEIDIYEFLGMDFKHLKYNKLPFDMDIQNMNFFLGDSVEYLMDYFYDFTQIQQEAFMFAGFADFSNPETSMFVSNVNFFWTDKEGKLKIKHIDFLEIYPIDAEGNAQYLSKEGYKIFLNFILNYKVPTYKIKLHGILNDFIELINLPDTIETHITKFLSDNPEILQYAFGFGDLNPQILLEWQYDKSLNDLQPDFMPIRMDGYAEIVEFKLPNLKSNPIVGTPERRHVSYEIDTAIAQLDTYEKWCMQDINTAWLEETYNIKVLNPRRYLIIGHSKDFTKEDRAILRNTRNTTVYTYDEFIENVRFQIYRFR